MQVARNGSKVLLHPRVGRRRLTGRREQDEIDRGWAMVAKREADLTIVVRWLSGSVTGCRGRRHSGRHVSWRDRQRVAVPGKQHRLEQEC